MKAEQYPAFKLPRSINGRVNYSKIIFGPLVKSVEKIVYEHPSFIKSVPLADRPAYISRLVSGPGTYCATDHTSYESSFTPGLCIAVEFEVFSHIVNGYYANMLCVSFYSLNVCVFKFFRIHVTAKRMSGDMNTSLGNGITNLITILFLFWCKTREILFSIVVEGDDSLFRTPCGVHLDAADFATLGLNTKVEYHDRLATAGFCGAIFHEADLKNLVDPGRILRRFGYVDNKYHNARKSKKMGLLRAYAFSIYYQYHGCPIVEALAMYLLRVTRGYFAIGTSLNMHKFADGEIIPMSEQRMFERFPPGCIGIGSREVVSSMFGFNYDEQLWCEDYLNSLTELQPVVMPLVVTKSHPDCVKYFERCAISASQNPNTVNQPPAMLFYPLIDELRSRSKHLEQRHRLTLQDGLPFGSPGPYCSCGIECFFWNDLLHGLRNKLGLKPPPLQEYHEHSFDGWHVDALLSV